MGKGLVRDKFLMRTGLVIVLGACALMMSTSQSFATLSAIHGTNGYDGLNGNGEANENALLMPTGGDTRSSHENISGNALPINNHFGADGSVADSGDTLTAAGFGLTPIATLVSPFTNADGSVVGTITSQAWAHTSGTLGSGADGHILFTYQLTTNTSTVPLIDGTIASPTWMGVNVIDAGELQGTEAYLAGKDFRSFNRTGSSLPEDFIFYWLDSTIQVVDGGPGATLPGGTASTILYIETDALFYTTGYLSLSGGSAETAERIPVLVPDINNPIPEPLTCLLFGSSVLIGLGNLRRRLF